MTELIKERVCAEIEGPFAVFMIGMRINKFIKPWKFMPMFMAMPRMLKELADKPELGLLSTRTYGGLRNFALVQYWRSAQHLQDFAHGAASSHLPAWKAFNAAVGSNGDVGIWHETYEVAAGGAEAVYVNMPRFGLGLAGALYPARGDRASAAKRLARGKPL